MISANISITIWTVMIDIFFLSLKNVSQMWAIRNTDIEKSGPRKNTMTPGIFSFLPLDDFDHIEPFLRIMIHLLTILRQILKIAEQSSEKNKMSGVLVFFLNISRPRLFDISTIADGPLHE